MLAISAVSSNPDLIPHPAVNYLSPNATAALTFTPVSGTNGTATITVTISDGQAQNSTVTRTFDVTVNGLPRISGLADVSFIEDDVNAAIQFKVSDAETEAGFLGVSATSSNPALLPDSGIIVGFFKDDRTLFLNLVPGESGVSLLTVTVRDGDGNATSNVIQVVVDIWNDLPTLDAIGDLTFTEDGPVQVVRLTGLGSGALNESQNLTLTAVSSDPEVVPNPVVGYTSPNTTGNLILTPAPNAHGVSFITVTVSDGQLINSSSSRRFMVTVNGVNDLPTLSDIPDQETESDTPAFVSFQVGDVETAASALTVQAVSSNPGLLPSGNVTFGGFGRLRTATLTPVSRQTGSATVTITVTDADGGTARDSFTLTVRSSGVLPSISSQPRSASVTAGDPVSFSVVATGTGTLSYQWQHDGVDLPGETRATLALSSARVTDAGNYTVTVRNDKGKVVSQLATLRVLERPVISLITYTEGQARISFNTANGLTYTLESSDSVDPEVWTAVTSISGNGRVMTLDDNTAPPTTRIYRIRVE